MDEDLISIEEFTRSSFADHFRSGNYPEALAALDPLLERYPHDPLLTRYRAVTLDRLGRSREAIRILLSLLEKAPDHVPSRYFLGLAYARSGDFSRARKELNWVVEYGSDLPYRGWAKSALERMAALPDLLPVGPRWSVSGNAGWTWDSNVSLKPSDKALASSGDRNADRFHLDLEVGHALKREGTRAVDLFYAGRYSAHDDSFDDLNFTSQELGLAYRHRRLFLNRPIWLAARYDSVAALLENDLFSWSNRFTFSEDGRMSPRIQTILTQKFSWTDFGPDGSNPPQTSRDGLYTDLGVTQTLYSSDFRQSLFLWQGYSDARTQGGNFERRGWVSRFGLHTPVTSRVALDLIVGFTWNRYPRFSSLSSQDPARRRDTDWDLQAALSHPLRLRRSLRLFYRWISARNRNDFFEYDRHLAGLEFSF